MDACGTICARLRFRPALFCTCTCTHTHSRAGCCTGAGLLSSRLSSVSINARVSIPITTDTMADLRELKMDFTLKELTLSCQTEDADIPGSSSSVELKDKKLVCVEYPALVTSTDKMLETLGGEKAVSKVSRLQLG